MTAWRKSSYSQTSGTTDCVEVAELEAAVRVRDSKAPAAPHLIVGRSELSALVRRIKRGELDL